MSSRASTSSGTPRSIAATVTLSALESASRLIVMSRAMVRDEGVRFSAPSAFSARRRRDAHSLTTRSQPAKSLPLEASPQLGAVALPGRPLFVKPLQMQLQRTLPDAEDVRALTA